MKGIVILLLLVGVVVIGGYTYLHHQVADERGHLLAVAFGIPIKNTIEIHVAVSDMMTLRDPPQTDRQGRVLWSEWVSDHWVLCDGSGQKMVLARRYSSELTKGSQAAGSPQFYLTATLKQGSNYTLDFMPKLAEGQQYRWAFAAPLQPQEFRRVEFQLLESDQG